MARRLFHRSTVTAGWPGAAPRLLALALAGLCACTPLPSVQDATAGAALGTGGSNRSMIFLAPTDAGPLVIDLGWVGGAEALVRGLRSRGWTPDEVVGVLITHAHRDHMDAWRVVAGAPFHIARAEVPLLTGQEPPPGPLDRFASRVLPPDRPAPGQLDLRPFSGDTILRFGRDSVAAFVVPGHTRGSAAYLFRSVLFVGDAAGASGLAGIGPPSGAYSHDPAAGRRNLARLLERLGGAGVRYVCTAHARCVTYAEALESF